MIVGALALVCAAGYAQLQFGRNAALATLVVLALLGLVVLRLMIQRGLRDEAGERATGPEMECANCHHVTPRNTFCGNCGIALDALPKSRGDAPRGDAGARLGRITIVTLTAAVVLTASAVTVVLANAREVPPAPPPCPAPPTPCAIPVGTAPLDASSLLAAGTPAGHVFKADTGFSLQYPDYLPVLGTGTNGIIFNHKLVYIVVASREDMTPEQAVPDELARLKLVGATRMAASEAPPAKPLVGLRHAVGGFWVGTETDGVGVGLQVRVAIAAAQSGGLTIVTMAEVAAADRRRLRLPRQRRRRRQHDPLAGAARRMSRRHLPVIASVVVIVGCVAVIGRAVSDPKPAAPPPATAPQRVGATPASREVSFTVELERGAGRRKAFDKFLADVADPASPSYRHFIDAGTFGRRFGAPDSRVDRVAAWLVEHGMQVDEPTPQRTALEVRAPAATVTAAFGVAFGDYRDRAGHAWHEPETTPQIPPSLTGDVAGIAGLSTRPHFSNAEAGAPGDGYDATTLARVYGISAMWNRGFHGEGQGIAIINYAPYRPDDIKAFDQATGASGLPQVVLKQVDGGADPAVKTTEPTLDIEVVRGLAPQAQIYEYEAPNSTGEDARVVNRIVADNLAKTISLSWGSCDYQSENDPDIAALDTALSAAAAAGINMVASSGDDGAYDCWHFKLPDSVRSQPSLNYPACTTWPIAVGGTRLALDEQGNVLEETGWEGWMRTSGTGGGPSTTCRVRPTRCWR